MNFFWRLWFAPTYPKHIGWKFWAALVILAICCGAVYHKAIESYQKGFILRPYQHTRVICTPGDIASKAAAIISNYSRDHPIFLQLNDYFWSRDEMKFSLPFGTNGSETLMMKLLTVVNQHHVPKEIDRLQCKRCVVIGNGHGMKNSSLGTIINRYDVVIRLNNAPVQEYENDVGSKTTFRLFYPESADFDLELVNNTDTLLVFVPFKNEDLQWLKAVLNNETIVTKGFWKTPPLIWKANPRNIRILNPYYMEVAGTELIGYNTTSEEMIATPTTGLMAITFAIHFCDQVHIAGFGYPEPNTTHPVHYYGNATLGMITQESGHDVPLEVIAIRKLIRYNIIHNLTYF
ncbi:CMP-N-acetylneuraminate-beta-galactosamide-alpha-2,3-sialyltransferase 4-like isoform X2 [Hyperolius riggenbachi]|uniref:CMP-N-acetylneuraminate-beta-galactosamide- alpha-2,3-sialyltransferase 4-like isoform X2 n=1 Tax=Hyperolius riggenbachi TaxID=752182 RepID=UPI0035A3A73A